MTVQHVLELDDLTPAQVAKERAATKSQEGFLNPAELLKQFPHGR